MAINKAVIFLGKGQNNAMEIVTLMRSDSISACSLWNLKGFYSLLKSRLLVGSKK